MRSKLVFVIVVVVVVDVVVVRSDDAHEPIACLHRSHPFLPVMAAEASSSILRW